MSFPYTVPLTPGEVITTSLKQICPLGTPGRTADGRSYRYAKNGTVALAKGLLVQSAIPVTTAAIWEAASFANLSTAAGTVAITSTYSYIDVNTTRAGSMTIAADFFKEGCLWVSGTSTESGQMMRIKAHTASSSGTAGQYARFTIDDGYKVTQLIDSGSWVSVQKNPYDAVITTPTATLTGGIVGVPNCDVAASTTAIPVYFWAQTWGLCPIKADAVPGIGGIIISSTQLAGAIQGSTELTASVTYAHRVPVGRGAGSAVTTDGFQLVHLTLEP